MLSNHNSEQAVEGSLIISIFDGLRSQETWDAFLNSGLGIKGGRFACGNQSIKGKRIKRRIWESFLWLKYCRDHFYPWYICVSFENIFKWDFLPGGAKSVKAFIFQIRNMEGGRKCSLALLDWMVKNANMIPFKAVSPEDWKIEKSAFEFRCQWNMCFPPILHLLCSVLFWQQLNGNTFFPQSFPITLKLLWSNKLELLATASLESHPH